MQSASPLQSASTMQKIDPVLWAKLPEAVEGYAKALEDLDWPALHDMPEIRTTYPVHMRCALDAAVQRRLLSRDPGAIVRVCKALDHSDWKQQGLHEEVAGFFQTVLMNSGCLKSFTPDDAMVTLLYSTLAITHLGGQWTLNDTEELGCSVPFFILTAALGRNLSTCDLFVAYLGTPGSSKPSIIHAITSCIAWSLLKPEHPDAETLRDACIYLSVALGFSIFSDRRLKDWFHSQFQPPAPYSTWDEVSSLKTAKDRFQVLHQMEEVKLSKSCYFYVCLFCSNHYFIASGEKNDFTRQFQNCSGCSTSMYCSKSCQLGDWSRHKKECYGKKRKAGVSELKRMVKGEIK